MYFLCDVDLFLLYDFAKMHIRMCGKSLVVLVVLCVVFDSVRTILVAVDDSQNGTPAIMHTYTPEYLLSLRHTDTPAPKIEWSDFNQKASKQKKKRGSRGGIRNRLRKRGCRLPLPAITLSNVRSLHNKMDELSTLTKYDCDFRRCSLFCFTETWLTDEISDINLEGYTVIRFDRDAQKTKKRIGGGLCMLVNNKWATNFTVRETKCSKHYEILTVSFRPFYLPREYGQVTVILAYVPGPDNTLAAECIAESYNKALSRSVDQPVFILGDFNTCDITKHLPNLHQYVTCPTRLDKTLDLCYGNVPGAYAAKCRPPLGRSDHNVVHLLPKYRQKLKREGPRISQSRVWTPGTTDELQCCFEATDWDIFFNSCGSDLDFLTDTITSYIKFCEDSIIPEKTVRIYCNNKPWINKNLKECLNQKKIAFLQGDKQRVRLLGREFRSKSKTAKLEYKNKVEEKFRGGNVRQAWSGLNAMMGRQQKHQKIQCDNPISFANELNSFYARFDVKDFKRECNTLCHNLTVVPITVEKFDVIRILSRVNPRKATGPDGLNGRILKDCATELGFMLTRLFQVFLDNHFIPRIWKTSTIIPVPKKTGAKVMNDFRPVALTSILCKCMERIVCNRLVASVADRLDPLQFAYKAKRGVEDATLTLFDLVSHHLDSSGTFVRILFMDFFSAFNTIQPHILLKRLLDLNTNTTLILWINAFLSDRPQRVSLEGHLSKELVLNTGAPQGCVLSPVLFSVYTNELMCNNAILTLIKFADDMALVARLKDELSLANRPFS